MKTFFKIVGLITLIAFIGLIIYVFTLTTFSERADKEKADISANDAPIMANVEKQVENNPLKNAYFGDLHVHTGNSFDAYIFNTRSTPDDAYNFAKGDAIRHPLFYKLNLTTPPLDFLAVTDHAEYMGILKAMNETDHAVSRADGAQDMFSTDPDKVTAAFGKMGSSISSSVIYDDYYDEDIILSTWQRTKEAADRHNDPGVFTTFSAYEYTAMKVIDGSINAGFAGGNLHRNVVFRDQAPREVFGALQSSNPEDLWDWMDEKRDDGMDVLAIPHNSNVSNGEMFKLTSYENRPLTKAHAKQRLRNEPIVEITQVKGTSETAPALSPNDEWADFEQYDYLLSTFVKSKLHGSFIREALANGLGLEAQGKGNPYQFGIIGSSDSHVSAGSYDEDYFWSKIGIVDGTKVRRGSVPGYFTKTWENHDYDQTADLWFSRWGASGLAVVWAEENTRDSLFNGMRKRETFGTSGTRIRVRLFAGYDYDADLLKDADLLAQAYAGGVPMGGELKADGNRQPALLAWAIRDPYAAPLQRLQIVKAWYENGKAQEMVFDAACSDGLTPDAQTHRCPDNGAKVDIKTCEISADKGDPELSVVWKDPTFKPTQNAAYYVRVLENPTCRWSTWDAVNKNADPNPRLKTTIQERAWSSPVWFQAAH